MEYIYGAKRGDYVKIGYTTDPVNRLASLSRQSSLLRHPDDMDFTQPLEVLFLVAGDRNTERLAHGLLGHLHVAGEWFRWTPQLEFLRRMPHTLLEVQPLARPRMTPSAPIPFLYDPDDVVF